MTDKQNERISIAYLKEQLAKSNSLLAWSKNVIAAMRENEKISSAKLEMFNDVMRIVNLGRNNSDPRAGMVSNNDDILWTIENHLKP